MRPRQATPDGPTQHAESSLTRQRDISALILANLATVRSVRLLIIYQNDLVMKRTITAICAALIISTSAVSAQQFSLWLTTDGAGIQINSGAPYGPPPRPHHNYGWPEYHKPHHRHMSKKMRKKYKKMRKAEREYHKARHEFYKHGRKHRH